MDDLKNLIAKHELENNFKISDYKITFSLNGLDEHVSTENAAVNKAKELVNLISSDYNKNLHYELTRLIQQNQ